MPSVISPVPRVITNGCTRNSAMPTPLIRPTVKPTARPVQDGRHPAEPGMGRHEVGRGGRHARDGKIDAPRQHHERLPRRDDSKRRREQHHVRYPERVDRSRPRRLRSPATKANRSKISATIVCVRSNDSTPPPGKHGNSARESAVLACSVICDCAPFRETRRSSRSPRSGSPGSPGRNWDRY